MPITPFLGAERFDPETKRILGVAFEMAHAALRRQGSERLDTRIAKRIIALAKAGERDPDRLCEQALESIGNFPELDVTPWLEADHRHIRASIDRISKSADALKKVQQRIRASAALIERVNSLKLATNLPALPKWIDGFRAQASPPENKTD